jgi:hypothetical protein
MRELVGPQGRLSLAKVQRVGRLLLEQAEWQRGPGRTVVLHELSPDGIRAASVDSYGWHRGESIEALDLKGAFLNVAGWQRRGPST